VRRVAVGLLHPPCLQASAITAAAEGRTTAHMAAWHGEKAHLDLLWFQMCLYLYTKHYCPENLPISPFRTHCAPPVESRSLPSPLSSFWLTIPGSVGPARGRGRWEVPPRQHVPESPSASHPDASVRGRRKPRGLPAGTDEPTDSQEV